MAELRLPESRRAAHKTRPVNAPADFCVAGIRGERSLEFMLGDELKPIGRVLACFVLELGRLDTRRSAGILPRPTALFIPLWRGGPGASRVSRHWHRPHDPTPSPPSDGGEGRGEEVLWPIAEKAPLPSPLPVPPSRGEGVDDGGSVKGALGCRANRKVMDFAARPRFSEGCVFK